MRECVEALTGRCVNRQNTSILLCIHSLAFASFTYYCFLVTIHRGGHRVRRDT